MTRWTITLFLTALFTSTVVQGQKLQLGLSANINETFFHKGQSLYEDKFFTTKTKAGFGLSIPCYFKLTDSWIVQSGIGFENKRYYIQQDKYDFPNVVDGTGKFYFQTRFTATEVPVIICFSRADSDKKYKIEYKCGLVLSYNAPKAITIGVEGFQYNGTDSCFYKFNGSTNFTKYFSPDLYIGISLVKTKETLRQQQLTLSYQFSSTPTTQQELSSAIWTASLTKYYFTTLKPTLSYIALTYTLYPKWLNIIKDKDGQTK